MTEYKEPSAPSLYPDLNSGQNYRLTKISEIQKDLEKEIEYRSALYKKYQRGINSLDAIDAGLVTASLGLGATGMTMLANVITAPVAIGLEAAAAICGLAGLAGNYVRRKLAVKAKKHDEIKILGESKLNTIADLISKALKDGNISDEEFNLILTEVEKYYRLKKEIRTDTKQKLPTIVIDEEAKNELFQRGREAERASILKRVNGN